MLFALLLAITAPQQPAIASLPKALNVPGIFSSDDYPKEAIRREETGTVGVRVRVDVNGRVSDCQVTSSSGSDLLDQQTCDVIVSRAVYEPARDRRRRPVAAHQSHKIRWLLPEPEPAEIITASKIALTVSADGNVRDCEFEGKVNGILMQDKEEACAPQHRPPLEMLLALRADSKREEARVVFENRTSLDPAEPAPSFATGSGERLVLLRSAQMSFDSSGQRLSCSNGPAIGIVPAPLDACVGSASALRGLAKHRETPLTARLWFAIYLSGEP